MAVKVGVIGVGYLGQHHARIYSELEEADLVAVVDIVKKKARAILPRFVCSAAVVFWGRQQAYAPWLDAPRAC